MRYKVSESEVAPLNLAGRDLRWVITQETVGAKDMSIAIMRCHPRAVVKPLHSHNDIEEVIYIVEGRGQVWIDGEFVDFVKGDSVFFPANSKHQVRNTGDETLVTVSIFSAPTSPDKYISYPESMFED
jgi:mannose-6-phosphate isomerase-like protein (cupin superfamily)